MTCAPHARGEPNADLLHRAETLQINPADAVERGIAEGTEVAVTNGEAELNLRAEITEDIPKGVVWLPLLHNQGAAQRLTHPDRPLRIRVSVS